MPGLLGKKIGMTSVFSAEGKNLPCTVIEGGCSVGLRRQKREAYNKAGDGSFPEGWCNSKEILGRVQK